jgi:hypothetical protein
MHSLRFAPLGLGLMGCDPRKRRTQCVRNRLASMVARLHANGRNEGRTRRDPRCAHATAGTRISHRLMRHLAHCGVSLAAATGLLLRYSVRSSTRSPCLLARPPYKSRRPGSSRLFAKSSHERAHSASLRRTTAATLTQKRTCDVQVVGARLMDRSSRWSVASRREGRVTHLNRIPRVRLITASVALSAWPLPGNLNPLLFLRFSRILKPVLWG